MNNDVQNNNSENQPDNNQNQNDNLNNSNQDNFNQNNNYNPNNQQPNFPPQGTKEYDDMMKAYYGQSYDLGLRVSFMKRLGAYIIDALFLGMISLIILFTVADFGKYMSEYMAIAQSGDFTAIMEYIDEVSKNSNLSQVMGYTSILLAILLITFETLLAASPGKLLFSIKIANLDRTNCDRMTLLKRSVLKNSSSILQFLGFLTALSVINGLASLVGIVVFVSYFFALGEKRQTLYDLICNTTVFHVEDIISDNQTNNNNY